MSVLAAYAIIMTLVAMSAVLAAALCELARRDANAREEVFFRESMKNMNRCYKLSGAIAHHKAHVAASTRLDEELWAVLKEREL